MQSPPAGGHFFFISVIILQWNADRPYH
jgi:hypothetical protein